MAFPFASSLYTTGETWVVAKRGARGGGVPSTTHLLSQIDRGVECPVRSTGVDGNGAAEPTHRSARRVLHGSQIVYGALTVAGVVGTDGETVIVVVRAACDLPESEPLWIAVVQPISQVAVVDVGFGLELEHRNAEVTADRRRGSGPSTLVCGAWESEAPVPNWLCTRNPW